MSIHLAFRRRFRPKSHSTLWSRPHMPKPRSRLMISPVISEIMAGRVLMFWFAENMPRNHCSLDTTDTTKRQPSKGRRGTLKLILKFISQRKWNVSHIKINIYGRFLCPAALMECEICKLRFYSLPASACAPRKNLWFELRDAIRPTEPQHVEFCPVKTFDLTGWKLPQRTWAGGVRSELRGRERDNGRRAQGFMGKDISSSGSWTSCRR